MIGEVSSDTTTLEMEGGTYFRVRVTMDVNVPLCQGRKISLGKGETIWVSFKYERLPILCYWCGCLGHVDRDCDKWIESDGSLSIEDREYSPWIRASPYAMPRKTVIKVLGYYELRKKEKGLTKQNCDTSDLVAAGGAISVNAPPTYQVQKGKPEDPMGRINEDQNGQFQELIGETANAKEGDDINDTLGITDEEKIELDNEANHNCGINIPNIRASEIVVDLDTRKGNSASPNQLKDHVPQHDPTPNPFATPSLSCKEQKNCLQTPRTWKRLPRLTKEGDLMQHEAISLKRPFTSDDCFAFPSKKRVVSGDQTTDSRLEVAASQPRQGL